FAINSNEKKSSRAERIALRTQEHLKLVIVSLFFAILMGVPLGILAAKKRGAGKIILGLTGAIQTIPSLALLVVLIKPLNMLGLTGIGDTPALIALFLYSLLPIVRGAHVGFQQIPLALRETSEVIGLSRQSQLFKIDLPLALPTILSGIKTAAVINVGFATLGALVGAGGYGQSILTGIRLDDYPLILEGAIPSAVLALVVQQLFDLLETYLVSPGLRK
ncbi:MAG: ABC transporter permease, partial [Bdellovibrionaceae bacterium]|nr:ABC transporter permease [Bdellovibrio sp.]